MQHKLLGLTPFALLILLAVSTFPLHVAADKQSNFRDVIKLIEQHYRVKHQGLPFLAKMALKGAGKFTRLGDYGELQLATFEDQDFSRPASEIDLNARMRTLLQPDWLPLISVRERETTQTYIYTSEAGKRFKVLIVTIEPRDAVALQIELTPDKMAQLIRDPEAFGETITRDVTSDLNQD